MVQPVMPKAEHSDYLATQAVADFLASSDVLQIDGILFRSVQQGADGKGLNVVLFRKASSVEPLEIPAGTEIDARSGEDTDDGWEVGFSVIESRPAPEGPADEPANQGFPKFDFIGRLPTVTDSRGLQSCRVETLRVCCESLQVHNITAVRVEYDAHPVSRQVWQAKTSSNAKPDF